MVDSEFHDVLDTTYEIVSNRILNINEKWKNKSFNNSNMKNILEERNDDGNHHIFSTHDIMKNKNVYPNDSRRISTNNISRSESRSSKVGLYNNISDSLSKLKTIINYDKDEKRSNEKTEKCNTNIEEDMNMLKEYNTKIEDMNMLKEYDINKKLNIKETSENEYTKNDDKYNNSTNSNGYNKEIEFLKNIAKEHSLKKIEKNINLLLKCDSDNNDNLEFKKNNVHLNNNDYRSEDLFHDNRVNNQNNLKDIIKDYIIHDDNIMIESNNDNRNDKNCFKNTNPYNERHIIVDKTNKNGNNNNINSNSNNFDSISNINKKISYPINMNYSNSEDKTLNQINLDMSILSSDSLKNAYSFYSLSEKNNSNNIGMNSHKNNMNEYRDVIDEDINISKFSNISNLHDSEMNDNNEFNSLCSFNSSSKCVKDEMITQFVGNRKYVKTMDMANDNYMKNSIEQHSINMESNHFKNQKINSGKEDANNDNLNSSHILNNNKGIGQNVSNLSDYLYSIKKQESMNNLSNNEALNNINVTNNNGSSNNNKHNSNVYKTSQYVYNPNDNINNMNHQLNLSYMKNSNNLNTSNGFKKIPKNKNIISNIDFDNNIFKSYIKENVVKNQESNINHQHVEKNYTNDEINIKNNNIENNTQNTTCNNFINTNDDIINKKKIKEIYKKIDSISLLNDLSLNKLESLNSSIMDRYTKNNYEEKFLDDVILDDSIFATSNELLQHSNYTTTNHIFDNNNNNNNNINQKEKDLFQNDYNKETYNNNIMLSENNAENLFKISYSCNDLVLGKNNEIILDRNVENSKTEQYEEYQNKEDIIKLYHKDDNIIIDNNYNDVNIKKDCHLKMDNQDNIKINKSQDSKKNKPINNNECNVIHNKNFKINEIDHFKEENTLNYESKNIINTCKDNLEGDENNINNINELKNNSLQFDKNILLKNTMSLQKDYSNIKNRKANTSNIDNINKYTSNNISNKSDIFIDNNNKSKSYNKTDIINIFSKNKSNDEDTFSKCFTYKEHLSNYNKNDENLFTTFSNAFHIPKINNNIKSTHNDILNISNKYYNKNNTTNKTNIDIFQNKNSLDMPETNLIKEKQQFIKTDMSSYDNSIKNDNSRDIRENIDCSVKNEYQSFNKNMSNGNLGSMNVSPCNHMYNENNDIINISKYIEHRIRKNAEENTMKNNINEDTSSKDFNCFSNNEKKKNFTTNNILVPTNMNMNKIENKMNDLSYDQSHRGINNKKYNDNNEVDNNEHNNEEDNNEEHNNEKDNNSYNKEYNILFDKKNISNLNDNNIFSLSKNNTHSLNISSSNISPTNVRNNLNDNLYNYSFDNKHNNESKGEFNYSSYQNEIKYSNMNSMAEMFSFGVHNNSSVFFFDNLNNYSMNENCDNSLKNFVFKDDALILKEKDEIIKNNTIKKENIKEENIKDDIINDDMINDDMINNDMINNDMIN
ncbi:hypothetical protein PFNF135_03637 [Plasmodium falciparum NF135/5.C10]|uniref:Uncharacterized protein n=1 Tax=Plasmodium falciparum NF135/5.C10 TaxID=1036726 RepID=W4IGH9_PLAFA|nr:hypothetical protein PFNF135_03637 [Plasmodium falciparum NF135/5.C10]